ncbi:hypothetical protein KSP39_PZI017522 [Platanthera zijinensis]|uniref:Trichome birefringence-like N-terminal domain-containing protein n=1 Tax=Platanthera zijinensis TaxID=2320716 RepID=A0AAP0FZY3_9ASPA
MKLPIGKFPLRIVVVAICAMAFVVLIFATNLGTITGTSIFNPRSCSRKQPMTNEASTVEENKEKRNIAAIDEVFVDEDKMDFEPGEECRIEEGEWVLNTSAEAFYSAESCPYLDEQVSCLRNGRPDAEYLHWEWKLAECNLPRFSAATLLNKLRGKRLMFTGDSLQRQQWQSLVCMIESNIPSDKKSMKRRRSLSVFKAEDYNATIEFYWAPFLVQSNSDEPIITNTKNRIVRVDSISKHAQYWLGADIIVFNSYVWWMDGHRMKSLWGSFANGEEGYEELDAVLAYRMAIKTWANWIDSNLNRSKTRIFFTTASPTHMKSADWSHENGIRCYNETRPVTTKGYWGSGSDRRMMDVVSSIVGRMKVPVTFINITQLSEYRKDGHVSIYGEVREKELEDEKLDPKIYLDCIHWCLPGVPDTWNQIFYAHL